MNNILKTLLFIASGGIIIDLLFGDKQSSLSEQIKDIKRETNRLSYQNTKHLIKSSL